MICRSAARSAALCRGVTPYGSLDAAPRRPPWGRKAIFPQRHATVKIRQCASPLQVLRVRGMSYRSRRCVSREGM
jgi:hypothetical protein